MERKTLFVDVILPLPLDGTFTYRVPYEMNDWIKEGLRVVVQFGQRKVYAAIVFKVHELIPKNYIPKYILAILDDNPVVFKKQFELWKWLSDYYISPLGAVMNAALPAALKLSSESQIVLNPNFEVGSITLNEKEGALLVAVQSQDTISLSQASQITEQKKVFPIIKGLIEKGVLLMEEELADKYKPRTEILVQLNPDYLGEDPMRQLFENLEKKAFKQLEVLMAYLQLAQGENGENPLIKKHILLKQLDNGAAALKALEKKNIFS
ncbi:MAG: primosomal protein N', partial [Bacteroidales bacterium]|nr:primosomal protein N' [Bacteroidales bacterium]